MLSGRWLLFFGVLWLSMNILMSGFGPAGVGASVPQVPPGESPILMTSTGGTAEQRAMTAAEEAEQSARAKQSAWNKLQGVGNWATWNYPDLLDSPVWGYIQKVWWAFQVLLTLQVALQVRQVFLG